MNTINRCYRLLFILAAIFLCVISIIPWQLVQAATYDWTQATRWREDAPLNTGTRVKYREQFFPYKGYDVRPHQQLAYMFPFSIVGFGNNKETSDNLWYEMYHSSQVIGNSTNLTRAKDIIEDFHINFISPFSFTRNYYFHFYTDNATSYVSRFSYPLFLSGGPNNGQPLLGNNRLIAVGDDNTLWFDNDGTLSIYNYPTGSVEYDSTSTTLSGGPTGFNGASLASKLSDFIGYEQSYMYFLKDENTLVVYNRDLVHVRTDELLLDGELWGYTLADLVDGNITNALYLGWDLGPVVAFVYPDYGGNPPVAANSYNWTHTARWLEDARISSGPVIYRQEIDGYWDSRPHQQLRSMYPEDIVGDGNNQATSDNLWQSILTSEHLIGNTDSGVRAMDAMEDFHYNFVDPDVADRNYFFYFYHDNDSLWLHKPSFPLTLSNGLNAGQSLLNNPRLLAVGDDNTLWRDLDGTLSYYNYPGGTLEYDSTAAVFPQGPPGWIGVPVVENLDKLIGYEQAKLYFLEGESTVHSFLYSNLAYLGTDVVELDGDLAGHSLADIIDHKVPDVSYGGWDLGPVFIMVDTTPNTSSVDHFRLTYASSALTCNPHAVIIEACEDASCSTLYTDSVTATLSPSGWVGGDTVTFTGGSANVSLSHTTQGSVSLGVSSASPSPSGGGTLCSIDGSGFSSACGLTFAQSGFIVDISDFLSARGETATISAVKEGDPGQPCVPAFASVNKNVSLWSDYGVPATGSMQVSVNGVDIGTSLGAATTQTLAFNASGQATAAINYNDAGQMHLHVAYVGSGADSGLVMEGSDVFVARPAGLCVSPENSSVSVLPYSDWPVYAVAGEPFNLITTAVAWDDDLDTNYCDNLGTPNYSAADIKLSSTVVSPVFARNGIVTPENYTHTVASLGANTVAVSESEVGVFTFSATPPKYFGAPLGSLNPADIEVAFTSQPTGRFIPHHFTMVENTAGSLASSCPGGNLYSGETTTWGLAPEFIITALNSSDDITTNYTELGYQKLTRDMITSQLNTPTSDTTQRGTDSNLLDISYTPQNATLSTVSDGEMSYLFNQNDEFIYTRSSVAEVAPFRPDLDFTFPDDLQDSDGVTVDSVINFKPDTSAIWLRYGRLWVEDTYGPETKDLVMPLRTEYFDGTGYIVNTDDNCTSWSSLNASVDTLTIMSLSFGDMTSGLSSPGGLLMLAPTSVIGLPDIGEANVTYDAESWLEGDYDNDGTYEDPQGVATFGLNRGHERIIFRKEVH